MLLCTFCYYVLYTESGLTAAGNFAISVTL